MLFSVENLESVSTGVCYERVTARVVHDLCPDLSQTECQCEEISPPVRAGADCHNSSAANVTPDMCACELV